jgi:hypothetical protein
MQDECQKFNSLFTLTSLIGRGGGSYVIKAKVNYDNGKYNLIKDSSVVIKLCDAEILEELGCKAYIHEVNNLEKLNMLQDEKHCGNFPYFHLFGNCCLFTNKEYDDFVPDILFYYANIKSPLPEDYQEYIINHLNLNKVVDSKSSLSIKHFNIISQMFPLTSTSLSENNIQEFLNSDKELNCSNYIVMSYVDGEDLSKSHQMLTRSLIFEMLYTNACLVKYLDILLSDIHSDNIIIGYHNEPRIYRIFDIYIYIENSLMFNYIDVQATQDFKFTDDYIPVGRLNRLGNGRLYLDDDSLNIIESISSLTVPLDTFMYDIIPNIFSDYVISENLAYKYQIQNPNIKVWSFD